MGVSPSRDFYKPHVERKQPGDNFHIASWGKIRFIQKFINILETWGSRMNLFVNNYIYGFRPVNIKYVINNLGKKIQ
jgi:hypothetical protein